MNNIENYTIKIDVHESEVLKYFDKEGIPYIIEGLPIGDYVIINKDMKQERICFERKTFSDFVGSVHSGRLFQQILNMTNNYEINYLFVVGEFEKYVQGCIFAKRIPPSLEWFFGTLSSLLVRYSIKVVFVKNHNQMIKLMRKIIEKTDDGKCIEFIKRNKLTCDDIKVNILTMVEGISLEKAKRILEKFTLYDLFYVGEEQLREIKGIGNKTASKIKEIFKV